MPIEQVCRVVEKDLIGPDTYWMQLECGDMVDKTFLAPGQFVHINCGHSRLLRRPISVATCQSDTPDDGVSIVFQVRGEGTRWLAKRQAGDRVNVLGLLGNGFSMIPNGRYLLAGGGIGVPPLYGCAQYAGGRAQAVLGFRSKELAIMEELFENTCEGVSLCTDDGSLGTKGFVHQKVAEILDKDKDFTAVLACGPKPMLKGVAEAAARYGVPCQVSMEERMACGVGACLGCAIQMADGAMKHVCKDGPVFNAGEVDWNV